MRGCAWAAVLIGAGLSKILCSQFGLRPGAWLPLTETALLGLMAIFVARRYPTKNCAGFILAIAASEFAWLIAVPRIEAATFIRSVSEHLGWGGQFFLSRVIRTVGAILMGLTLLGSGTTRRELFLCVGDWRTPVQPEPFLSFSWRISWARFGVLLILAFGILLTIFYFWTSHPQIGRLHQFLSVLPWAIATSAVNAANEEFQFRSVLLARLRTVVHRKEAMLLVAVLFGLGHYFGQPSGSAGAIIAGIAGWILAKSMIETRGFTCAFLIHFVADFVIFAFLMMSGVSFPKG